MAGKLIVLEGLDGSGTTTQAARMHAALQELGLPVHVTEEPSSGPVGSLIRQILHGRIVTLGLTGGRSPSWPTMTLLFAADRLDHIESEVAPNLNDGINVISDRYVYSSLAYQAATSGDEGSDGWIAEVNRFARPADLILFLEVGPEEAYRRRLMRRIGFEMYDDSQVQIAVAAKYREVMNALKARGQNVVFVDGERSVEEVSHRCIDEARKLLLVSKKEDRSRKTQ